MGDREPGQASVWAGDRPPINQTPQNCMKCMEFRSSSAGRFGPPSADLGHKSLRAWAMKFSRVDFHENDTNFDTQPN